MADSRRSWFAYDRHNPPRWAVLYDAYYIIRRALYRNIVSAAADCHGVVLDFGCGRSPYKDAFSHVRYVGADVLVSGYPQEDKRPDVYFDGVSLPFRDASFDAVIATEVLEHVPDERVTLSEIRRVLKPEGRLVLTVPFTWPEHEMPHDYRRFTSTGLEAALARANFRVLLHRRLSAGGGAIAQLFSAYLVEESFRRLPRLLRRAVITLPIAVSNVLGCLLSRSANASSEYYIGHYIVATAERPGALDSLETLPSPQ